MHTLHTLITRPGHHLTAWGGLLIVVPLLSACTMGLPDEKRYGYALPVQPAPDVWSAKPPPPAMPTLNHGGMIVRLADASSGSGIPIEAVDAATGEHRWQTTLPVPTLVSVYNRNETSFVTDTALLPAGTRLLATYRYFTPPQPEANGTGVRAAAYFWQYAIIDAATGRLLRHEQLTAPASERAFVLVGGVWLLIDNARQETSRLDAGTGERLWRQAGLFRVSVLTSQTVGLYRHILGDRWNVAVLDINTGRALFEQTFDALPMQTIRAVTCRDNVAYVEFGAQYEFNVELGARYQSYTVAFDAASKKPLWRTDFSPKKPRG